MIVDEGLPMAIIGKEYKGIEDDIIQWLRSRYPDAYKNAVRKSGTEAVSTRTRGQASQEEYGIVENENGKRRVVEGEEYVKFRFDRNIDGERLVSIQHRGTCSFEQIFNRPIL